MESCIANHRMITRSKLSEELEKPGIPKDSSKRSADYLPDVGNKKRILGDITNQPKVSNIKSIITKKSNKSCRNERENPVTISNGNYSKINISERESFSRKRSISEVKLVSESEVELVCKEGAISEDESMSEKESSSRKKSSILAKTSFEDSMYTTALEDSIVITSADTKQKHEKQQIPEGVEDFDKTCAKDPYSESRYAYDIFKYYLKREKLFPVKKYMSHQKDMTKGMRAILVDWMVEVQESFELNHETLYLAVKLVDRYLMKHHVPKADLQLVGATAICIAAKFDERQPPLVDDFLYICDDTYTREQLIQTEIKMLQTVDFDLGIPLSYRFLRRYSRCTGMSMELLTLARYILEASLMDYELIDVLDSKLAAGSLLLAIKMKNGEWTPAHEFYTGYKENDLKDLIFSLNKMISGLQSNHLQTIKTKYSHQVFFEVSKIPPLNLSKSNE